MSGRVITNDDLEILKSFMNDSVFQFKDSIRNDYFDLDKYYALRFAQRAMKPDVNWPQNLSKKERVLCKLNMLREIMQHVSSASKDPAAVEIITRFLKEEYSNCYVPDWNGISIESSEALNVIYSILVKSYGLHVMEL